MAKVQESFNPFYPLLLIAGVAFLMTACAYGVMAFRDVRIESRPDSDGHDFMQFMQQYGGRLMLGELAALGVATAGLIGLDRWRYERQQKQAQRLAKQQEECITSASERGGDSTQPAPNTSQKSA